jgi:hypothetical protein
MSCSGCGSITNKVVNIAKGYYHLVLPDKETEKLANARLDICNGCVFRKVVMVVAGREIAICNKCKCPLDAKTRVADEKCDESKW